MIFEKRSDAARTRRDDATGARAVPLLPLRDLVVFPYLVIPLSVGREKSISAVNEAMARGKEIFLAAQKKAKVDDPSAEDIYEVGTLSQVMQLVREPNGTVRLLVEGRRRARILRVTSDSPHLVAEVEELPDVLDSDVEVEALIRTLRDTFDAYVKLEKRIPPEILLTLGSVESPAKLADILAAQLNLKLSEKQDILETTDVRTRLEVLLKSIQSEIEILQVQRKIRTRVKKQMEKTQKEYYLNEQMQAIQRELGEKDEFRSEVQDLEARIAEKHMPEAAREKAQREMRKLKMMSPMSAEATVVRNYIDWILALPWLDLAPEKLEIDEATRILDDDHFGLRPVKDRILEYLAVRSLVEKLKGPILCLVGPPGVGKTSLARSVARATGREFVRVSLGGVRDEAEIRGHRRTYIGAMPGKVIQGLKRCRFNNPVILLDEIDKMSTDFRGDPSAALLEVLDPEQNHTFADHYLDLDYDLSRVMFVATANSLQGIPWALQDRMEIIRLAGYTEDEKLSIATRYLVPKQREANGLTEENLVFRRDALKTILRIYTKEAGVRNLEREIATVCRKVAKRVVRRGRDARLVVGEARVKKLLGVPRFQYGRAEAADEIGLVNGLAWTQVGGEMLGVESMVFPGKGKLILTGKLGEVFQESAQSALSYVRSRTRAFGLADDFYQDIDIHVHLPGFQGTDGPSAGITIASSMVSTLLRIPVRRDVAMTGEITLRGKVRAIGGLKEKLLAAHRGGVKKVLIPKENEKDLEEVPRRIRAALEIVPVEDLDQVLGHALALEDPSSLFRVPDPAFSVRRAPQASPAGSGASAV
ncbi:endopeptidase La [Myxococcota bacterium]|nr:endopeptidase La [Myxococcota bacterium]